jgi:uncharacterized LabA/DUF88 family protein
MSKTIVFIDSQNAYLTAREAFGWESESSRRGNFRPLALGELLAAGDDRELVEVRVYTGVPSQERDDQGYRAARKRFDTWKHEGNGKVTVCERNLQYRRGEKAREKGVDVLLAIHLVRLAAGKKDGLPLFDLAVVLSADNDLVPALELVCDMRGSEAVESVSMRAEPGCQSGPPLGVSVTANRAQISRRTINRTDYEKIEDTRSYNPNSPDTARPRPAGPLPGQSGRALPTHRA